MFTFDLPHHVGSLLTRCEREDICDKLVGLSLMPAFQANHLRILTLLQVALVRAAGHRRASYSDLTALLNGLKDEGAGQNEDPAEDVFVSSVSTDQNEYRIFNSIYPANDFYLQRMLDCVSSEDFGARDQLAKQCDALLLLSETVAQRCGLARNQYSPSQQWQDTWPSQLRAMRTLGRSVRFSAQDLAALGIDLADLDPFILKSTEYLLDCKFGETALCRRPLLREGTGIYVPIPAFISPALRLHLAHVIARGGAPRACAHKFHELQLARWVSCDLPRRGTSILDNSTHGIDAPECEMPGDYAHVVVRFDENKLAHIAVIGNDWSDPPDHDVSRVREAGAAFEIAFTSYLKNVCGQLRKSQGIVGGLTILVQDTPGWHINIDPGEDADDEWFTAGVSAYSLSMLLADPQFSLLELWKMLREQRRMLSAGSRFMAWPDLLNYWSIWRKMGHTFWPEAIDARNFGSLLPDTGLIQEQVVMTRLVHNVHSVLSVDGTLQPVERWLDQGGPDSDASKPLYFQPLALVLGELRCVVEGGCGPWWVASARPPFDPQDRHYMFLLWQTAAEWMLRLAYAAPAPFAQGGRPIEIRILPVPDSIKDAPKEIEFVQSEGSPLVTLIIPPNFQDLLATPDNRGEAVLVQCLAKATSLACKIDLAISELDKWASGVTSDTNLKMMHINMGRDVGLVLDVLAEKAPFRVIQLNDTASASRHMRDELVKSGAPGVSDTTEELEGENAVNSVLKAAVDIHWFRCRKLLREIDRAAFLVLVSRLIEAIQRHRVDGERAALSRSRFYAESPDIDQWAMRQVGSRDVAFRAYRIAAEMAVCECPVSGGRMPGISDVDTVAAEIAHLIWTADSSDAVRFGLVKAGISFLPDGALVPFEGGAKTFMEVYTMACLRELVAADMDAYPALYNSTDEAELESASDVAHGDLFLAAFEAEQGISLQDAATVSAALQEVALDDQKDVIAIRHDDLQQKLQDRISPNVLARFVSAFGLHPRRAWDEAPAPPFDQNDVWPWLFERRLSLMMRPLLVTSNEENPVLVYGVRQLDMGVHYASVLLESGTWPLRRITAPAARKYVNLEVKRRGDAFENEIALQLRNADWQVFQRVPMTHVGATAALGEIDILAVPPDGTVWLIAECKWFGAARTPREVAGWMQDYRGVTGDKLDRHLKRHAWIHQNKDTVAIRLGIASPTTVSGRIVTTAPIPLAFTEALPEHAEVWTKRGLSLLIANSELQSSLCQKH